ncbi:MAG: hypothetical protein R2911_21735 [Caldilineaceae bacterium]
MAAIDAFLAQPTIEVKSGLVTGYDFMQDQADAIHAMLDTAGVSPNDRLNGNSWTAAELQAHWLDVHHDVVSLNAHFDHYRAVPCGAAERSTPPPLNLWRQSVRGKPTLQNSIIFSVGCHSGLNMPDAQVEQHKYDFAQALVGAGAIFVANTGYGYATPTPSAIPSGSCSFLSSSCRLRTM